MSAFPTQEFKSIVADLTGLPCENVSWDVEPQNVVYPRDGSVLGRIVLQSLSRQLADYGAEYIDTFNPTGGDDGAGAIETRQKATYIFTIRLTANTVGSATSEWAEDTLERFRFRLEHLRNKSRLRELGLVLISQDTIQISNGESEDNRASTVANLEIRFRRSVLLEDVDCTDYLGSGVTEVTQFIDTAEPVVWQAPASNMRIVYATRPNGGQIEVFGEGLRGATWSVGAMSVGTVTEGDNRVLLTLPALALGIYTLSGVRFGEMVAVEIEVV